MRLSLVIPAYNEARRIGATLDGLSSHGTTVGWGRHGLLEVIVVCDGCTDSTEDCARQRAGSLPLRLVAYPRNQGKGHAVRQGMLAAGGDVVVFMDADGATPPPEIGRVVEPIAAYGADIVLGSRRVPGAHIAQRQPLHRRAIGRAFSLHNRLVLGIPFLDTQCGLKAFKGGVVQQVFSDLRCTGFAFDLELSATALARGLRVVEVGVAWHDVPGSTVSPLRDGLRMLVAAWRVRGRLRRACPRSTILGAVRVCAAPEHMVVGGSR